MISEPPIADYLKHLDNQPRRDRVQCPTCVLEECTDRIVKAIWSSTRCLIWVCGFMVILLTLAIATAPAFGQGFMPPGVIRVSAYYQGQEVHRWDHSQVGNGDQLKTLYGTYRVAGEDVVKYHTGPIDMLEVATNRACDKLGGGTVNADCWTVRVLLPEIGPILEESSFRDAGTSFRIGLAQPLYAGQFRVVFTMVESEVSGTPLAGQWDNPTSVGDMTASKWPSGPLLGFFGFHFNVLTADFDLDNDVDGGDFLIWQANYNGGPGKDRKTGDANGDGLCNGADFLLWQSQFGKNYTEFIFPPEE